LEVNDSNTGDVEIERLKNPHDDPLALVAEVFDVNKNQLKKIIFDSPGRKKYYRRISITKNSPTEKQNMRVLHAVLGPLKNIQTKVYERLVEKYSASSYAKGFIKGESIISNAFPHRRKSLIMKFDIKDFFPSITFPRVRGMFMSFPFNFESNVSTILARICCLEEGPIPQGGVTSPYLSNMICRRMDANFGKYAKENKLTYTRYADDITLSTDKKNLPINRIVDEVAELIKEEGFQVNNAKTKILFPSNRQIVTGIVVNDGLNVPRKYIREVRAILNNCQKHGVLSQALKHYPAPQSCPGYRVFEGDDGKGMFYSFSDKPISVSEAKKTFMRFLRGRIQFIGQVAEANKIFTHPASANYQIGFDLPEQRGSLIHQRRFRIFKNLVEEYERVRVKERFDGSVAIKTKNAFNDIITPEILDFLSRASVEELNEYVVHKASEDSRFFYNPPTPDPELNRYRANIIALAKKAQPLKDVTKFYLHEIENSEQGLIGRLVHKKTVKLTELEKLRIKLAEDLPRLPYYLGLQIKLFLNQAIDLMQEMKAKEMVFTDNDDFQNNHIQPFRQKTRFYFGPHEHGASSLELVQDILNKPHVNQLLDRNDSEIEFDPNSVKVSMAVDVMAVKVAFDVILESMLRHTKHGIIQIYFGPLNDEPINRMQLIVSNNITSPIENSCDRSEITNGKLKSVMKCLHGLADYQILANFSDTGWAELDLYSNQYQAVSPGSGFSHKVTF
jgi:retron-type reverse transcriptase